VTTQKENKIYVHVLNWTAPLLALPPIPGNITGAASLRDGSSLEVTQSANGVILKLPPAKADEPDRVVVLTCRKTG
jgi:alpha-L-fucosidase